MTDAVSGNNLTVKHVDAKRFYRERTYLTLSVDENAFDGTGRGIGLRYGYRSRSEDPQLLAADPYLRYGRNPINFPCEDGSYTWSVAEADARNSGIPGKCTQRIRATGTIRSATENELVRQLAAAFNTDLMIGGSDQLVEGTQWYSNGSAGDRFWQGTSTGSAVDAAYNNFATGEPNDSGNEDGLYFWYTTGEWNGCCGFRPCCRLPC
ncbi:MAG: hypothetical protein R3C03_13210 [Pirellulaceae bacterium]